MLSVVLIISFIVGANLIGFGTMLAVVKFQEAKEFKAQAGRNSQALYAYRVRYGAEGVEF